MTNVGGATSTKQAQSGNMINFCTKYGFDVIIISGRNLEIGGCCFFKVRPKKG